MELSAQTEFYEIASPAYHFLSSIEQQARRFELLFALFISELFARLFISKGYRRPCC